MRSYRSKVHLVVSRESCRAACRAADAARSAPEEASDGRTLYVFWFTVAAANTGPDVAVLVALLLLDPDAVPVNVPAV